ncbi:Hsp70 family protein [Lentzea sp. NBRC 102530]|uniref:Hsp70 family protein n=1 Tax=Lentzea sp. NBRC 102530 TaxID=3032201 RepID=UPI0024A09278|nr:Hsp70 family protein [Lentzea sp. NBRC 102530]GLY51903.1 molecular chaperone DnaK [Lentzea sp. NBRC 102530]
MAYVLGVDVGTTRTTAAVCRLDGARDAEIVLVVPSLLQLTDAGTFSVGDRPVPGWSASGFARRVGDAVPFSLGPELCPAEELTALLIMWVVGEVVAREGEQPRHLAVSHPAGWGPYRRGQLYAALRAVGLHDATLVSEPLAAAENHAVRSRVTPNASLAVFSLGSHAFSASVVRRAQNRTFELVNHVDGVDHHTGADFDDLLLALVRGRAGKDVPVSAAECEAAKRAFWPSGQSVVVSGVEVGRDEFVDELRPAVEHLVSTFVRAVGTVQPDAVLLIGGGCRMPVIGDVLSSTVDCRVLAEAAPEHSVAKGLAVAARLVLLGPEVEPEPFDTSVLVHTRESALRFPVGEVPSPDDDEFSAPPPRPPVDVSPLELPPRRVKRVTSVLKPVGRRSSSSSRSRDDDEDGR